MLTIYRSTQIAYVWVIGNAEKLHDLPSVIFELEKKEKNVPSPTFPRTMYVDKETGFTLYQSMFISQILIHAPHINVEIIDTTALLELELSYCKYVCTFKLTANLKGLMMRL